MLAKMARYLVYGLEAILILFSVAVASPYVSVDSKLKPYHDEYMRMVKEVCRPGEYNKPIKRVVGFGDTAAVDKDSPDAIGWCLSTNLGYKIMIDRKFWLSLDTDEKFQLMAHEMSHCVLGLEHRLHGYDYMAPAFFKLEPRIMRDQVRLDIEARCVLSREKR